MFQQNDSHIPSYFWLSSKSEKKILNFDQLTLDKACQICRLNPNSNKMLILHKIR